jgi:hypothetical protein
VIIVLYSLKSLLGKNADHEGNTQEENNGYVVFKRNVHRLEPVFVYLLRSQEIDSQPGGPVRQPYLSYWPVSLHRLAESIPLNRFLGSINVYKYGLCWEIGWRWRWGGGGYSARPTPFYSKLLDNFKDNVKGKW